MPQSKQSKLKIFLINLFVLVALLLLFSVLGEIALRSFIPKVDHTGMNRLTSSPLTYEMIPNLNIVREGVQISTNSDGFRDTEFTGEPKPGQFVIAVLGDSFTFGQGVPQSETFPAVLQKLLNSSKNSDRFRVWNLGVCGYNIEQESYLLADFVLPRKPNWVVVGYNIVDCRPIQVDPDLVRKEEKDHRSLISRLIKYVENDLVITQLVKQRTGNLIRLFDPNWYASSYVQDTLNQYLTPDGGWIKVSALLKKMKTECDKKGIGFTIANLPAMMDFTNYPYNKANDVIISFCKDNDIDCVDILPYFKGHNYMKLWVSAIDGHANADAQQIFAKAVAVHLEEKLSLDKN